MSASTAVTDAEIIQFPAPVTRSSNRMSVRDRIEALRWSDTAAQLGYTRVFNLGSYTRAARIVGNG